MHLWHLIVRNWSKSVPHIESVCQTVLAWSYHWDKDAKTEPEELGVESASPSKRYFWDALALKKTTIDCCWCIDAQWCTMHIWNHGPLNHLDILASMEINVRGISSKIIKYHQISWLKTVPGNPLEDFLPKLQSLERIEIRRSRHLETKLDIVVEGRRHHENALGVQEHQVLRLLSVEIYAIWCCASSSSFAKWDKKPKCVGIGMQLWMWSKVFQKTPLKMFWSKNSKGLSVGVSVLQLEAVFGLLLLQFLNRIFKRSLYSSNPFVLLLLIHHA